MMAHRIPLGMLELKYAKADAHISVSVSGSFTVPETLSSGCEFSPESFLSSLISRSIWAMRAPGYHLSLTVKLNELEPPRETLEFLEAFVRDSQVSVHLSFFFY